jgi:acetyl-CoA carboxylase biotin carboxyl carrier protein
MNLADLTELISDLQNTSITRLKIDSEGLRVEIDWHRSGALTSPTAAVTLIPAPIAGTFGPPRDKPLVKEGDAVQIGQVLCVIDAAGQQNEIESEVAGKVTAIHGKNGEPVKAGEVLFEIVGG